MASGGIRPIQLISGPGRRSDVRQFDPRLRPQALKRRADCSIALHASDERLNKNRVRIAPHNKMAEWTLPRMERDDLLVFLVRRAVIEANGYPTAVKLGPALDETQVSDRECETFHWRGRQKRGEIAHSLAQTINPTTIFVQSDTGRCPFDGFGRALVSGQQNALRHLS